MINVFKASCGGGVVTVEGKPVNVAINGEGLGASEGYLVISETEAVYLPKTTPDVKEVIEKIEDFINTMSETISIIQSGILNSNMGGQIKLPTFDADIILKKESLLEQKEKLRTLKDRLK